MANPKEQPVSNSVEKQNIQLNILMSEAHIGTWEWDIQNHTVAYNKLAAQILGYTQNELSSQTKDLNNALIHPEDQQELEVHIQNHLIGQTSQFEFEYRIKHKTGSWVWVFDSGKISNWHNGQPQLMLGIRQDITAKKNAEIALHESHERNRIFVEQAPNALAMFNTNMEYLAASQQWIKDYKLEGQNIIGKSHYDIFPEVSDDWKKIHQECLAGAINKKDEVPFTRADGSTQWISWDVRPWYISKNEIGGILMYTAEVSHKKLTEIKLKHSEELFKKTFEHSAIGMALIGTNGEWIKVNKRICEIVGYTSEELLKTTFQAITHPDDLDKDLNLMYQLLDGKIESYEMEKRYYHKNGKLIWIFLAVSLIRDSENKPLHFVSQIADITERKNTQNELQKALTQIKQVFSASTYVSIISTNTEGIITAFNKGAENLLGYSAEDMVGKHTPASFHLKDEIDKKEKALSQESQQKITGFNVFIHKAKQGLHDSGEWTYVHKNGSTFPVQLVVTAMYNTQGDIYGFLGIAVDISKQKNAEQEMKSLLDVTNDQNKRLLNFAHIVSHNLRSHSGNLSMLLNFLETDEGMKDELLPMLRKASNNLEETIVHLNEVVAINSRIQESLQLINLNKHINTAIGSIEALLKAANGKVINNIKPDTYIYAIPAYLDSTLLNLFTNAIKYSSKDRKPIITLNALKENKKIAITITDNGLGIDLKKHGNKLFGMYKTFHGNKDARGIGLFITKNQIEAMGGEIHVESKLNEGTTFKVILNAND